MADESIRLSSAELGPETEDRFDRFRLIGWWDQERLRRAKVLVVGAGALGNEIVKNLALLGCGNLLIADLDRIENSNLSRSVLYRGTDVGKPKAEQAAKSALEIYPEITVHAFRGDVVNQLGLGAYRWADLVIAGLDNREARLSINRNCWRVNRPWIDGAIEQIQGCARVFVPDGPCYECTMSERDWQSLRKRRSCNLLTRQEMLSGRTPTTPTISSIIAGMQCQEAVKLLHGLPTIAGKGWIFEGLSGDSYLVEYQRKHECYSHETWDEVVSLPCRVSKTTISDLQREAERLLGRGTQLELTRDVVERLVCPKCGETETVYIGLSSVPASKVPCPKCPEVHREAVTFYRLTQRSEILERKLSDIGVPPFDIVLARNQERSIGLELSGDAASVLGPLAGNEEAVEWM